MYSVSFVHIPIGCPFHIDGVGRITWVDGRLPRCIEIDKQFTVQLDWADVVRWAGFPICTPEDRHMHNKDNLPVYLAEINELRHYHQDGWRLVR